MCIRDRPGRIPTTRELLERVAISEDVRAALVAAHAAGQPVVIDYASFQAQGVLSASRTITIQHIGSQKVHAFCHLRQAERTFRLDRIRRVTPAEGAPAETDQPS